MSKAKFLQNGGALVVDVQGNSLRVRSLSQSPLLLVGVAGSLLHTRAHPSHLIHACGLLLNCAMRPAPCALCRLLSTCSTTLYSLRSACCF